jgi:hypothetical protein
MLVGSSLLLPSGSPGRVLRLLPSPNPCMYPKAPADGKYSCSIASHFPVCTHNTGNKQALGWRPWAWLVC